MRSFKTIVSFAVLIGMVTFSGCGYTTKTVLPRNIKTIYVETVKNKIPIHMLQSYQQGLEMDITNAVIGRLQQDGNLKVVPRDKADSVLKMNLIEYQQEGLRYTQLEEVMEYRLFIVLKMQLVDNKTNETIWEEPNFSADTEYFVTNVKELGEQAAAMQAVEKLAKNVVDRIVEDW